MKSSKYRPVLNQIKEVRIYERFVSQLTVFQDQQERGEKKGNHDCCQLIALIHSTEINGQLFNN